MDIKEIRRTKNLTQAEASKIMNIPLRTFKVYENNPEKIGTIKYNYILDKLNEYSNIDENHGILDLKQITQNCTSVLSLYDVDYCILFGSYARGNAAENSDVDLLVATSVSGMRFYGMVEKLRSALHKNVDVLDLKQLIGNRELINNILREGKRIYVQKQYDVQAYSDI